MKKFLLFAAGAFALSLSFSTCAAPANARTVCNHDPVCQAKRDGVSVNQAKATDRRRGQTTGCAGSSRRNTMNPNC
jgi:hypothetical protein